MSDNGDHTAEPSDVPLSEVGLLRASQEQHAAHSGQIEQPSLEKECDRWKTLFELQQRSLTDLIRAIQEPRLSVSKIALPEFNPDLQDSDARAWCETVDLCLQEKPLSGGDLIITMSKALKGTAASWLAQSSYPGITWAQLKDLFLARFDFVETPAANLWRLFNGNPKEGECLSSYASRFMSAIMARWKSLSTEQIAIAVTLAHAAKIEPRLQRLAFTTEIDNRIKLQQELMAFTFRKRGPPAQEKATLAVEAKKPRPENSRRCYNCNKFGHVATECRWNGNRDDTKARTETSSNSVTHASKEGSAPKKTITPTCFNCGEQGHIATRCPGKEAKSNETRVERRVDICTIKPATDHLSDETDDSDERNDSTHEDV
ncbi:uncharacterized protein LOC123704628 [Colias croceus]|uniref:uncharacterized protein LOC123704628 n=1 Tax=Colias crocea TaxID=72248 RepID=UPI001E280B9F|nr:uncharacterized protein LOC123704628 [Colias croceus]